MSQKTQTIAILAATFLLVLAIAVFADLRTESIRGKHGYVDCFGGHVSFCAGPACDAAPAICVKAK